MAVTSEMLADAEAAYHALLTGKSVVRFRDQNGETVEYQQASRAQLAVYIESLRRRLDPSLNSLSGPMQPWFC